MTKTYSILSKIYEEVADLPNPEEVRAPDDSSLDFDDIIELGEEIEYMITNMGDPDEETTNRIEDYLEPVDPEGKLEISAAVALLPLEDAQDLYEFLASKVGDEDDDEE